MTWVEPPASGITSASLPTATKRPSATATAVASGFERSSVVNRPLCRMRSGWVPVVLMCVSSLRKFRLLQSKAEQLLERRDGQGADQHAEQADEGNQRRCGRADLDHAIDHAYQHARTQ